MSDRKIAMSDIKAGEPKKNLGKGQMRVFHWRRANYLTYCQIHSHLKVCTYEVLVVKQAYVWGGILPAYFGKSITCQIGS